MGCLELGGPGLSAAGAGWWVLRKGTARRCAPPRGCDVVSRIVALRNPFMPIHHALHVHTGTPLIPRQATRRPRGSPPTRFRRCHLCCSHQTPSRACTAPRVRSAWTALRRGTQPGGCCAPGAGTDVHSPGEVGGGRAWGEVRVLWVLERPAASAVASAVMEVCSSSRGCLPQAVLQTKSGSMTGRYFGVAL